MKFAAYSFLLHVLLAFFFSVVYWFLGVPHFSLSPLLNNTPAYIDYLALSTTVQAGVGVSNLSPASEIANAFLTLQQFLLIAVNVGIVYILLGKKN